MKIHLISDIHLEFHDLELPGGDVLVIAGDAWEVRSFFRNDGGLNRKVIAPRLKRFVAEELPKYKHYVYVPGNHEYYGRSIEETHTLLLNAGLKILQDDSFMIDGVAFYGTTLWTDANGGCPVTEAMLQRGMSDFRVIQNFNVKFMRDMHVAKLHLLTEFVASNKDAKIVVVTHHAPSELSVNSKYKEEYYMNGGYRSELRDFIQVNPQIKLWCHGHMHDSVDYVIGKTRVISNPRGYYGYEPQAINYKPLEIEI